MEIRKKEGRGRRKEEEIKTRRHAAPPSIDGWRWRGHMPEAESWLSFFLFLLLPRLFFFFFFFLIPLHKAGAQPLDKSGDQEFDLFFSSFYPFRSRCYGHSSINQSINVAALDCVMTMIIKTGGWGWVIVVSTALAIAIGHGVQLAICAILPTHILPSPTISTTTTTSSSSSQSNNNKNHGTGTGGGGGATLIWPILPLHSRGIQYFSSFQFV